mgnify:CR=1 FL=1
MLARIYEPFRDRLLVTNIDTAELIKHASNSFLAMPSESSPSSAAGAGAAAVEVAVVVVTFDDPDLGVSGLFAVTEWRFDLGGADMGLQLEAI